MIDQQIPDINYPSTRSILLKSKWLLSKTVTSLPEVSITSITSVLTTTDESPPKLDQSQSMIDLNDWPDLTSNDASKSDVWVPQVTDIYVFYLSDARFFIGLRLSPCFWLDVLCLAS